MSFNTMDPNLTVRNPHSSKIASNTSSSEIKSQLISRRNVFSAHLKGELNPQIPPVEVKRFNFNIEKQHIPFDKYGCILPRKSLRKTNSVPNLFLTSKLDSNNSRTTTNDTTCNFINQPNNLPQTAFDSNTHNIFHGINVDGTVPNTLPKIEIPTSRMPADDMFDELGMGIPYDEESELSHDIGPVEAAKRYLRDALETRRSLTMADITDDSHWIESSSRMLSGRQIWQRFYGSDDVLDEEQAKELLETAKYSLNIGSINESFNHFQNTINSLLYREMAPTLDVLDLEYMKPLVIQPEDILTVREESMDGDHVECEEVVYNASTASAKRNLTVLGTSIYEIYDLNDEFMSTDPLDYATLNTCRGKIIYSPKFQTDKYYYRYIILPKAAQDVAESLCKQRCAIKPTSKNGDNSPTSISPKSKFIRYLDETEISKHLGVHMSSGWQHFFVFKNSMKEIILRKKI